MYFCHCCDMACIFVCLNQAPHKSIVEPHGTDLISDTQKAEAGRFKVYSLCGLQGKLSASPETCQRSNMRSLRFSKGLEIQTSGEGPAEHMQGPKLKPQDYKIKYISSEPCF